MVYTIIHNTHIYPLQACERLSQEDRSGNGGHGGTGGNNRGTRLIMGMVVIIGVIVGVFLLLVKSLGAVLERLGGLADETGAVVFETNGERGVVSLEDNSWCSVVGGVESEGLVNAGRLAIGALDEAHLSKGNHGVTVLGVIDVVQEVIGVPGDITPSLVSWGGLVLEAETVLEELGTLRVSIRELELSNQVQTLGTQKVGKGSLLGGTESVGFRGKGGVEEDLLGVSVGGLDVSEGEVVGGGTGLNGFASLLVVGSTGGGSTSVVPIGGGDGGDTIGETLDAGLNISLGEAGGGGGFC